MSFLLQALCEQMVITWNNGGDLPTCLAALETKASDRPERFSFSRAQRSFHAGTQKSDVNGHNPELSFLVTLGTWLAVLHLDMMIQPIRCSDPSCPFMTAYLLASRSSSTAALPFNVFAFFPFGSASFWIASSFFASRYSFPRVVEDKLRWSQLDRSKQNYHSSTWYIYIFGCLTNSFRRIKSD